MNHGLMNGMFWAGVLLSAIPVLVGIGIYAYAFSRYRAARQSRLESEALAPRAPEVVAREVMP